MLNQSPGHATATSNGAIRALQFSHEHDCQRPGARSSFDLPETGLPPVRKRPPRHSQPEPLSTSNLQELPISCLR